jgi:glycosyltransferase involved in cell wall biosynthesis
MATHNGAEYIKKQVDSILEQLGEDDELIISDDCSTDDTVKIVCEINDARIKVLQNEKNIGYTRNFEWVVSQAKGDIIFLSDQDDIWAKNKVIVSLGYLEKYDIIVSDATLIDENETIIGESFFNLRKPKRSIIGNIVKFGYLGCCMTFKKEVLKKACPFPKNSKLCTHDNWIFLIGCCFFNYKILPEKLMLYRRHTKSISSGGLENTTSFGFKIKYRIYLIYNLLKRL